MVGLRQISIWISIIIIFTMLFLSAGKISVAAETNYALEFNGFPNYVNFGRTNVFMSGTGWVSQKTISFWIKPAIQPGPSVVPTSGAIIISTDRPKVFGITLIFLNGADRIWVWNVDANGIDTVGITFDPGQWVHLSIVHDGSSIRVFKNGVLTGSILSGPTLLPSPTNDGIVFLGGSGRPDPNSYFVGRMDEIQFWNTALSQESIQEWMNREITPDHPQFASLSSYFKLNNGTGIVLLDDSYNAHEGALLGGMGDPELGIV